MAAMLVAPGEILTTVMISAVAFVAAYVLIGRVQHYNLRASLFGLDLNKKGTARENTKMYAAVRLGRVSPPFTSAPRATDLRQWASGLRSCSLSPSRSASSCTARRPRMYRVACTV